MNSRGLGSSIGFKQVTGISGENSSFSKSGMVQIWCHVDIVSGLDF